MARVPCGATSNPLHEVLRGIGGLTASEAPTGRGGLVCESEERRLAFTGKLVSLVYDRFASETTMPCTTSGPYCR
jgi:hypothetical protein